MSIGNLIENEDFYHVYQPIYYTDDFKKVGYEALLRSNYEPNPEILFNKAKNEKQLFELDSRSIQKAVRSYFTVESRLDEFLFVNIYPSTIVHSNFPSILNEIMIMNNNNSQVVNNPKRIVFEISESEIITDNILKQFKNRILEIKELGGLIAIDDIGKGFDTLALLIEIEPHFLKLDRYFSIDLFESQQKQTMIRLFKNYCDQFNCKVILEGIENELDLEIAKTIGIQFVQGFLLGRPMLLK